MVAGIMIAVPAPVQLCKICQVRRPRRYCPGVSGDICPLCCGNEREVTVNCPLDCVYLREARSRERLPEVDPKQFPNPDVRISEDFLRKNEPLLIAIAGAVARASLQTGGVVDSDTREALDSMIRTYRTLQSGLYYESRPDNVLAASVQRDVKQAVEELQQQATEAGATIRDGDILGVLVFLQRLGIQHANGRPKGRAFIHFLQQFFPAPDNGGLIATG
jgi:hypothetical protein